MNTEKKNPKAELESKRPGFFVIGTVVACGLALVAFEWRTPYDDLRQAASLAETIEFDDPPPIVIPMPEPPDKQVERKKQGQPQASKQTFTFVVRKPAEEPDSDLDFPDFDEDEETGEPPMPIATQVVRFAEEMPQFPGGEEARVLYLRKNIRMPFEFLSLGESARVYVQFVIWTDGSVRDVEIINSPHPSITAELQRTINAMPTWVPGKQGGKAVPVCMVIPVNFAVR